LGEEPIFKTPNDALKANNFCTDFSGASCQYRHNKKENSGVRGGSPSHGVQNFLHVFSQRKIQDGQKVSGL